MAIYIKDYAAPPIKQTQELEHVLRFANAPDTQTGQGFFKKLAEAKTHEKAAFEVLKLKFELQDLIAQLPIKQDLKNEFYRLLNRSDAESLRVITVVIDMFLGTLAFAIEWPILGLYLFMRGSYHLASEPRSRWSFPLMEDAPAIRASDMALWLGALECIVQKAEALQENQLAQEQSHVTNDLRMAPK